MGRGAGIRLHFTRVQSSRRQLRPVLQPLDQRLGFPAPALTGRNAVRQLNRRDFKVAAGSTPGFLRQGDRGEQCIRGFVL